VDARTLREPVDAPPTHEAGQVLLGWRRRRRLAPFDIYDSGF